MTDYTQSYWSRVQKTDTCWLWTGTVSLLGYGMFHAGGLHFGAHRLALLLAGTLIPDGYEVDHLCQVKHCVRPDHLDAVTHSENIRRAHNRGNFDRKRPLDNPLMTEL